MDEIPAIVIDLGSGVCKCGFSGDEAPKATFDTVIGLPKTPSSNPSDSRQAVGKYLIERLRRQTIQNCVRPIDDRGVITNWDKLEPILYHSFYSELRAAPEEHPVLLLDPAIHPKANREKLTQMFFETFCVPAFYVSTPAVLSLIESRKTTGLVLDCGYGASSAIPIYEGKIILDAVQQSPTGGKHITEYLRSISLHNIPPENSDSLILLLYDELKKTRGFVSQDFSKENIFISASTYEFPDGKRITLSNERFWCAEALFQPNLMGPNLNNENGVHNLIYYAISRCPLNIQNTMYNNCVLSGGSSLFPGFSNRLEKELSELLTQFQITPQNKNSAWFGGSKLAISPSFQALWISKEEYDEYGPNIVLNRCHNFM